MKSPGVAIRIKPLQQSVSHCAFYYPLQTSSVWPFVTIQMKSHQQYSYYQLAVQTGCDFWVCKQDPVVWRLLVITNLTLQFDFYTGLSQQGLSGLASQKKCLENSKNAVTQFLLFLSVEVISKRVISFVLFYRLWLVLF